MLVARNLPISSSRRAFIRTTLTSSASNYSRSLLNSVSSTTLIPRTTRPSAGARTAAAAFSSHSSFSSDDLLTSSVVLSAPSIPCSSTRNLSSYSSFDEPHPSLLASSTEPISTTATDAAAAQDTDFQLRKDIRMMGSLLGQVIKDHDGEDIFKKVEDMRALAKKWREAGAGRVEETLQEAESAFRDLAACASKFSDKELFLVSRAFTHFLALANAAESHHRARRLKEAYSASGGLFAKPDSCGGVLLDLLDKGYSDDDIWDALTTQTTELVLTAHPTQVNRRTILDKKRRIQEILTSADDCRLSEECSSYAVNQLDDAMYREISSIWLSDEVSRYKPTPQTEAEKGVLVIETVLWESLPRFMRKLDTTVSEYLGRRLPLDCAPIKFASWMGGDRDGNPNVQPNTTREVCLQNRASAASLFTNDLMKLEGELSINSCSDEMRSCVGDAREPYRAFLKPIIEKMKRTKQWAEGQLEVLRSSPDSYSISTPSDIFLSKEEFMDELKLIHRSLGETGNERTADGTLTDIMRNVSAFGLTLVPLDIRQESDRHEEAIDAITRFLGLGSFSQWDEQTRISWLSTQISSKRPLIRPGAWNENPEIFLPTAVDTLETFQMIAEQHEESLGAYVISQCTSASDILSVLALQVDAGVKKPLRVVPLFETLGDLKRASDTMRRLFSLPAYMGAIEGKQEVMVGYSDSAKDAGRLAASWAQYETQELLSKVARDLSVDLNFFHGKGGTVGRGGNPQTFEAILSHPPNTINGKFRVTEQGEMIHQNFGFSD